MTERNSTETMEVKTELLGPEDIERHALELARYHNLGRNTRFPKWLTNKVTNNYKQILEVYQYVNKETAGGFPPTPTAEWLLDNFYILEEQFKDIKVNLHKKYFKMLPVLTNDELRGYPRVYAIAEELVTHTDGSMDEKTIIKFLRSYQTYLPLTVGELWAMAAMLRIALVEKVSSICEHLQHLLHEQVKADQLTERLMSAIEDEEAFKQIINVNLFNSPKLSPALIEHLASKLRRQGRKASPILGYMDQRLGERETSLEQMVNLEHQGQAARQVAMGNCITSLRAIAAMDWSYIFEDLSHVEETLRKDPALVYGSMDFDSRDHYRHMVEKIARHYKLPEIKIAQLALKCAENTSEKDEVLQHVGYYLIGHGRLKLEEKLQGKARGIIGVMGTLKRYTSSLYFSSIIIITAVIMGLFLNYAFIQGLPSPLLGLLTALVILIPSSDIGINLVNFAASYLYAPAVLPKLELKGGIPKECSTFVIMPTLLTGPKRVQELLDQLEIYYLANRESNLYFALVGDFKDSREETVDQDSEIVDTAFKGVQKLNQKYGKAQPIFYYFHRNRQYNEVQGAWMGWERKRGAIIEFNDLLRGQVKTNFQFLSCQPEEIPKVQYIITLDADTNLTMGNARRLIGTMAHPLNKPVVDEKAGKVVKGHGILQPRIGVGISSANKTFFSRIFAGQGGIDPYTTAVSDIYQDLFGEGIFTGKGIYHLDTFQGLLKEAIPENRVLSHDLLEGSYLRAGLVTDIELLDGYPPRYNSFSMRLHRWVRGDWQLIPWLGGQIRDRQGRIRVNPLSNLSKWKIIDNLRRSLLNPALFVIIALGFTLLPGNGLVWLSLALVTITLPTLNYLAGGLIAKKHYLMEGTKVPTVISGVWASLYQAVLQFLFIPYQAYLMADAIIRTIYRITLSKKHLLEWVPAADLETLLKNDLPSFYKNMISAPLLGLMLFVGSILTPRTALELAAAGLILGLWAVSPYIAFRVSQDYVRDQAVLTKEEQQELRVLARKTWAYFEDLVTVKDNYLPPDNYQVDPPNGIAHRTSPTNMGLGLVAILTARDLGYIGTKEMLEKINLTLTTIEKMEKWEGHLYNWYDTAQLGVLRPRYVSTVDSGNFVGYLMVLVEGIKEYLQGPIIDLKLPQGLKDTILVFNAELINEYQESENLINTDELDSYLNQGKYDAHQWRLVLEGLTKQMNSDELASQVKGLKWGRKLMAMVDTLQKEGVLDHGEIQELGNQLLTRISTIIDNTKFAPLFDEKRHLFSIGYHVEEGMLTNSYYDLLASEARQASYIAIARGEVDKRHWFRLGRKLTQMGGYKGLVSWTGTMFEYFMPHLIMKNYENSLLDATYTFAVKAQQKYGQKRGVPWGVSESAYYAFDVALNYQYKAFGVPELGFKRGLGNEIVVAPYATILALTTDPKGSMENIKRLKIDGMEGEYGFYEAVDYTPSRAVFNREGSIIKNFMVHHQGMSMLVFANYFSNFIMQRRFHANPIIRSAEVLLQERMPYKAVISKEHREEYLPFKRKVHDEPAVVRNYGTPKTALPHVHLLSNGNYSVMLTNGGSGYSRNQDMAVARWRENLRRSSGFFIYIQNINSNNIWSAAFEPLKVEPEAYKAVFSPDKVEYFRTDGNIESHTQIVVTPEDNAEIRKVSLTNNSQHTRVLELTSYLEVVLTQPDNDLAHPTFSNLFVTTEFVPEYQCLLANRRPRSHGQKSVWAIHTVTVEGEVVGDLQYETDRAKFVGRNRDLGNPTAMDVDQPLSNTIGAVLDPIMSLRRRIKLEPGQTVRIAYILAVAENRETALTLADKYRDVKVIERAFEFAWNRSQIEAGYLGIKAKDEETYLNMIPHILYPGPTRRKWEAAIIQNSKGQPGLWPFGISGDVPIVLALINDKEQLDLVYKLLKGHEFWRMKGLKVDLVFLAEDEAGYTQPVQDGIREAINTCHARDLMNRMGGVFLLNTDQMSQEEKTLLYTVSRIILKDDAGTIEEQLSNELMQKQLPKAITKEMKEATSKLKLPENIAGEHPLADYSQLAYFNGLGGFSEDGKEYVIHLKEGQHTPAPWINVIANPQFGFNITEVGAGYTWAENSRENKLTPWYNDPVTDLLGEVFYLRDEADGSYWSITPMPIRGSHDYLISHGLGYSIFQQDSHSIEQELTEFAVVDQPVKICLVKLKNLSQHPRELSITHYIRPVLGVNDKINAPFITSEAFGEKGILVMSNSYNSDFSGRKVFMDTSELMRNYTGDGDEFFGINGSLENPAALTRESLSGTLGAGLEPCGALQVKVSLQPNETKEVVFLLGQAKELAEVRELTDKFSNVTRASLELQRVKDFWTEKLGAIQVSTPEKSMDIMLNGWLQYQVIACRIWSRAAFYQSGGAYGFRDQLQDVMAASYTWPELARNQILLHCAHQFVEGDVQHWWHPGADKGIRTRYSDDYLWLPYVTADYLQRTEDWSVLDEEVGFLEDEPLPSHEDERYSVPRISSVKDTVYVHCIKAIENGLKFGEHGIPLMGSGDWNDGMNTVGNQGKGESVWLGWFLYTVLQRFIPVCEARHDEERAEKYKRLADEMAAAIEKHAWDGSWYRRAYFDDGTPLGSAENSECKIDAIAQSWSVISGVGKPSRAEEAMNAVDKYLVDREAGIIKLLSPPFGQGHLEPGYIKGYVPGVRENGGQYTHAAVWTILAFAKLGMGDKVIELFNLINPINHTRTSMDIMRYKVEPYVLAADVYAVQPNTGRGGWSWYTGAAGWMYRVGLEHILGVKKNGNQLTIDPCIAKDWPEFTIKYKYLETIYNIQVKNPERVNQGVIKVMQNGQEVKEGYITLQDDGGEHQIEVIMGKVEAGRRPRGEVTQVDISKNRVTDKTLPISAAKKTIKP